MLDEYTAKIKKKIDSFSARIGVCATYDNIKLFSYNENDEFDTACGIIAFVFLEYVRQIFLGILKPTDYLIYEEKNFATGAGVLKFLPFGSKIQVADVALLMVAASDHVAANIMIDALGFNNINSTIRNFGFSKTKLLRKPLIPKVKNIGISSPSDYTNFFSLLRKNCLISSEASEYMKSILLKQKYKDIISGKILESTKASLFVDVASKSGKADGKMYDNKTNSYITDGGIVYTKKGNYEVSLFADIDADDSLTMEVTKSFLQDISMEIFIGFCNDINQSEK